VAPTPSQAGPSQGLPVLIEPKKISTEIQYETQKEPKEVIREKRQEPGEMSSEEPVTEALQEEEEEEELDPSKQGPGLGFFIGVATLVCTVIYIIGITYKLIKIHKGTYVEEEPIFLKYK